MDSGAVSDKALSSAQTMQTMFGGGPIAGVAAVFAAAFFALLLWHLWRGRSYQAVERDLQESHRRVLAELNEARLKESMQVVAAINLLSVVQRDFAQLVEEARRRSAPRRRATDKPFDPETSGTHRIEPSALTKPPGNDGGVR